jgi:hypothetical protein
LVLSEKHINVQSNSDNPDIANDQPDVEENADEPIRTSKKKLEL